MRCPCAPASRICPSRSETSRRCLRISCVSRGREKWIISRRPRQKANVKSCGPTTSPTCAHTSPRIDTATEGRNHASDAHHRTRGADMRAHAHRRDQPIAEFFSRAVSIGCVPATSYSFRKCPNFLLSALDSPHLVPIPHPSQLTACGALTPAACAPRRATPAPRRARALKRRRRAAEAAALEPRLKRRIATRRSALHPRAPPSPAPPATSRSPPSSR